MLLNISNLIFGSSKTIREPDSHTLWSPQPWELCLVTYLSMGLPLVSKSAIREQQSWHIGLIVQISLRILTYSSSITYLNEDPQGNCPSSLQTKELCFQRDKCVYLEIMHILSLTLLNSLESILLTSTKSSDLLIGVLNLLELPFLFLIFQPPWFSICSLVSGLKFFLNEAD